MCRNSFVKVMGRFSVRLLRGLVVFGLITSLALAAGLVSAAVLLGWRLFVSG